MSVDISHISMVFEAPNGETEAIRDVSLHIADEEFVSIVGPSGCGKSTLLSIIAGLERPTGGVVKIDDAEVKDPSRKIGYMLQRDHLFDWRTIMSNVTLCLEVRGLRHYTPYACELLEQYGLMEFADKYPSQLSGGMRQRCALIRTLAAKPELLLLDEPFSALDYQTRLAVADDIHFIIKKEHKTAVMVTHDISEAISMSDRVIVLSERPAVVKAVHELPELAGLEPMQRRDQAVFRTYFNDIWKELDIHAL